MPFNYNLNNDFDQEFIPFLPEEPESPRGVDEFDDDMSDGMSYETDTSYTTTTTTTNTDTTEEIISSQIYDEEIGTVNLDKISGKYYIGILCHYPTPDIEMKNPYDFTQIIPRGETTELMLDMTISPKSFFQYDYDNINHYLKSYSFCHLFVPEPIVSNITENIQIMQVFIHPTTKVYNVVVKTFWLRHFQRICRKRIQTILASAIPTLQCQ
jgi:hypothetical protein